MFLGWPDATQTVEKCRSRTEPQFDVVYRPDGTATIGKVVFPDGTQRHDLVSAGQQLKRTNNVPTIAGGGNRKDNTMKRIATLMLALLIPLAAFAGTKQLTCAKGTLEIVLDEAAGTALVSQPLGQYSYPLASATFTPELVTWSYHYEGGRDGYHFDDGYTTDYKLDRMTGILYMHTVSDAKNQHDNYGNWHRTITDSSTTCEISQQKF
jgi:hypothetical protein